MKIKIPYHEAASQALKQIADGTFLTLKVNETVNTMTLGWGSFGFLWNKPVFMAMVRFSRYSYALLQESQEFTISVPKTGTLRNELALCGSRSGKTNNKIEECKLSLMDGDSVKTPIIQNCPLHIECRVIYRQAMEPSSLEPKIIQDYYLNGDFHYLFYGEILNSYLLEKN